MTRGLPTTTRLAVKLWQVAKIQGHKNPFGKPLLDYNEAELDFVLEMEAKDNPGAYVFERAGVASDGSHQPAILAAWAAVKRGKLLDRMFANLPFAEVAERREKLNPVIQTPQAGMTPGLRQGRAIAPKKGS